MANGKNGEKAIDSNINSSSYENPFYKISFENGGINQVFDKEFNKNLFTTDSFKVGDVYTMQSVGNGAGEFGDIQQPSLEGFEKASAVKSTWKIIENGPVYTTYHIEQEIRGAIAQQEVTIYHNLKRIYFKNSLRNWTGELFREFRTAFPINMDKPEIAHEVPFGRVRVGKDEIKTAGERYTPLCKDVHPRAIIDWISATDNEISVTLSSSVAAADWVDPTALESNKAVLQNILLASRTSCHWQGNEYSQAGNHYYQNVFTSNKANTIEGQKIAKQKNEPIQVVVYPDNIVGASLPETASFFSIDAEDVMVTTIKKAEDTEDMIVRMYNTKDSNEQVNISSFFKLKDFKQTNIIEENPTAVSPQLKVGKYAIETFSIEVAK